MEYKLTAEEGYYYIELNGRLDAGSSGDIQDQLMKLSEKGNYKMLICMEKVDYISSSGLRAFLAVAKKLGTDGYLKFCCLQPSVQEVFTISGFNTIFNIYNNKEEALQE
jgi:anti-sigma B factor antagonist